MSDNSPAAPPTAEMFHMMNQATASSIGKEAARDLGKEAAKELKEASEAWATAFAVWAKTTCFVAAIAGINVGLYIWVHR